MHPAAVRPARPRPPAAALGACAAATAVLRCMTAGCVYGAAEWPVGD
jgi:hypothetical protein